MTFRAFRKVYDGEAWGKDAQVKLNNAISGKLNVVGTVTLDANAASTLLVDDLIKPDSHVVLTAETDNAAQARARIPRADYADGEATIRHVNDANADKIFTYSVLG